MARIRTIKPEFWSSEQVMECQALTRLLFIGIWNFCDDGGNHPDSEKTIKARVFPGDEISSSSIRRMLDELSSNGLLSFYEHSGKRYLHVCGWEHQRIDKPTLRYPEFVQSLMVSSPPPVGAGTDDNQKPGPVGDSVGESSPNIRPPLDEASSNPLLGLDPGREGKGNRKGEEQDQEHVHRRDAPPDDATLEPQAGANGQEQRAPDQPALADPKPKRNIKPAATDLLNGFDQFYRLYPRRQKRPDAESAWKKLKPDAALRETLLAALASHCLRPDWIKDGGQYIPLPATWLNGRCWEDEILANTEQSNHVDLDKIDHTFGLERQPDGTYRVARP
ncbi:hypothetical protein FEM54_05190 [Pseudomonas edaphica]|uniref:Helix-turn-helix domain-containing protein n=1 Tax=Pseudomonas edaphica TaxID=2006980 RepID=A0ABY2UA12_9PSED|nr:hypothetical protein [Pseudomonas edaphica]TLG93132.1 hypothetical protein FEM54_05190 [Pseudomonas edaphica]